jgi:surface protein
MSGMFEGVSSFNQNLGPWDVSNVTDMHGMFSEAFNQNIRCWDVSNVFEMGICFKGHLHSTRTLDVGMCRT